MSIIEWSKKLEIEYEPVDKQHRKLVEVLNSLEGLECDRRGRKKLAATLQGIVEYTQYHFAEEEKLMKKINYCEYEYHKMEHKKLIRQVMVILLRLKKGKPFSIDEMILFLTDWVINHIKGEDNKIGIAIKAEKRRKQPVTNS